MATRIDKESVIDHADAQRIASEWHSGQASGLYSLASTGKVHRNEADKMLREIERERVGFGQTAEQYADLGSLTEYVKYWGPVYECVVWADSDSYNEFEAVMYPDRELGSLGWPLDDTTPARDHLLQWEYGEMVEPESGDPRGMTGQYDEEWSVPVAESDGEDNGIPPLTGYVMCWHTGLSYVGLYRVRQRPIPEV